MEGLCATAVADDKVARVVLRVNDCTMQGYCSSGDMEKVTSRSSDIRNMLHVVDLAPAGVSHLSLVPVVREQPILEHKPALLITLDDTFKP